MQGGDFDRDGDVDLLLTGYPSMTPLVLRNDGATFSPQPLPKMVRGDFVSAVPSDFDGDGDQDLLMRNRAVPKLQLFENVGLAGHSVEVTLAPDAGSLPLPLLLVYRNGALERVLPGPRALESVVGHFGPVTREAVEAQFKE